MSSRSSARCNAVVSVYWWNRTPPSYKCFDPIFVSRVCKPAPGRNSIVQLCQNHSLVESLQCITIYPMTAQDFDCVQGLRAPADDIIKTSSLADRWFDQYDAKLKHTNSSNLMSIRHLRSAAYLQHTSACGKYDFDWFSGINNKNTHLMAIFQDNPVKLLPEGLLSGFYWAKDDGDSGDNWSYKICKSPVELSLNK